MKKIGIMIGVLLLSAQFLFAATVSLKGSVKNAAGAGIAGVNVSLTKLKSSSTTDATGAFTLVGTQALQQALEKPQFKFSLVGNALVISPAFENVNGCVDVFSSNGKKTASILFKGTRAGKQTVNLPEFVSGLNIIRITMGAETITQSIISLGNSNVYLKNDVLNANATNDFSLAKQAATAAVDTIVSSKTGYTGKKTAIASYTAQDIAITLDTLIATACPAATLPAAASLTYSNAKHPDPFTFKFMNLPKVTTKAAWECRRQEIYLMTQQYLYGHMPAKPESVTGTVSGGTISVTCKQGSKSANFSVTASGSGSILVIDFSGGATAPSGARKCTDLDPDKMIAAMKSVYGSADASRLMALGWGVGRIIDVLEQNPTGGIDATKVVTTGCSFAGKYAMGAGIFEPRVAICIPVESGCAGVCSWRVSSKYGHGDSNTDCQDITHLDGGSNWCISSPFTSGSVATSKLPFDQDEVCALRAPGAMIAFDNGKEQYKWLCNRGAATCAQGTHWIYKALGISDNFGFYQANAGHTHCGWPSEANTALNAFYDKFLNGKTTANTNIQNYNSASIETSTWFDFGTGKDQWDTTTVLQ